MMKKIIAILTTLLLVTGCDTISEDERLIYVKPAAVSRHVLIEDFTGQRCVNCPKASDEIQRLQEQYGDDVVIAVGIHGGPLAFYTNAKFLGLRTETGDEYYDHWKLEYQPIGLIDRGTPSDYTSWNGKVREELAKTAPVSICVVAEATGSTLNMKTTLLGVDGNTNGKLQLWLVEDEITAFQLMPDGSRNDQYVHQHVFRTAVNGTWGEEVSIVEGQELSCSHSLQLDDSWNIKHLSIVAFVYNGQGVQQVTKVKLIH